MVERGPSVAIQAYISLEKLRILLSDDCQLIHASFYAYLVCFARLQKSNPLPEEEKLSFQRSDESKRQNIFQEQLRAERESFRAVFDKRRQRIGRLDLDEE